jgi:hypothetical protein
LQIGRYDPLNTQRYVYEIRVKTADKPEAAAGAHLSVWITLYGQYGNSKRQRLTENSAGKTWVSRFGHLSRRRRRHRCEHGCVNQVWQGKARRCLTH